MTAKHAPLTEDQLKEIALKNYTNVYVWCSVLEYGSKVSLKRCLISVISEQDYEDKIKEAGVIRTHKNYHNLLIGWKKEIRENVLELRRGPLNEIQASNSELWEDASE